MQGQITSGTCSIAQKAALGALLGDRTPTTTMRNAFLKRRNLIVDLFKAIPDLVVNNPDGAFYLFPDCSAYFGKQTPEGQTIKNSTDLALYILNHALVSIVPGEAFGNDDCIRISFAASEEQLIKATKRITASFAALV
jgi:aspartate aminotransferase